VHLQCRPRRCVPPWPKQPHHRLLLHKEAIWLHLWLDAPWWQQQLQVLYPAGVSLPWLAVQLP